MYSGVTKCCYLDAFALVLEEVKVLEDPEVVGGVRAARGLVPRSARHLLQRGSHRRFALQ